MKQGEIWFVKFPEGIGHEFRKERPAIIIENDIQIIRSSGITVVPLTSNTKNCLDEDIFVSSDNYNNLASDSIAKVHHIQTFDKTRFLKKIGKVKINILEELKDYLKVHFDL